MTQPPETFQTANVWFYSTFNLDKLTFGDANYTKLVQKAMHDGWMKGMKTKYGLKQARRMIFKNRLRNLLRSRPSAEHRLGGVLYFASSRRFISRAGLDESFYGQRWFELWEEENIVFTVMPEMVSNLRMTGKLSQELKQLKSLVKHCEQVLGSSHALLPYLDAICFNYFVAYGMASDLIQRLKPKRIVLTCHYGKEGLIRAARQHGAEVIEIQHGIIDENDIFYCYPEPIKGPRKLAMFADSIFTFGKYWSSLLSQFHEFDSVIAAGDYTFRAPTEFKGQQNRVLITTQTGMVDDYLRLIMWVASEVLQNEGWDILIRHHPLECPENLTRYRDLCANYPFISESVGSSLSEDFQEAKVHLSIYSTTLFDASRWPLRNFSVQNFGSSSSYAASILRTGVVEGVEFGACIPLQQISAASKSELVSGKSDYFYSEFPTVEVLRELSKWSV